MRDNVKIAFQVRNRRQIDLGRIAREMVDAICQICRRKPVECRRASNGRLGTPSQRAKCKDNTCRLCMYVSLYWRLMIRRQVWTLIACFSARVLFKTTDIKEVLLMACHFDMFLASDFSHEKNKTVKLVEVLTSPSSAASAPAQHIPNLPFHHPPVQFSVSVAIKHGNCVSFTFSPQIENRFFGVHWVWIPEMNLLPRARDTAWLPGWVWVPQFQHCRKSSFPILLAVSLAVVAVVHHFHVDIYCIDITLSSYVIVVHCPVESHWISCHPLWPVGEGAHWTQIGQTPVLMFLTSYVNKLQHPSQTSLVSWKKLFSPQLSLTFSSDQWFRFTWKVKGIWELYVLYQTTF